DALHRIAQAGARRTIEPRACGGHGPDAAPRLALQHGFAERQLRELANARERIGPNLVVVADQARCERLELALRDQSPVARSLDQAADASRASDRPFCVVRTLSKELEAGARPDVAARVERSGDRHVV